VRKRPDLEKKIKMDIETAFLVGVLFGQWIAIWMISRWITSLVLHILAATRPNPPPVRTIIEAPVERDRRTDV
jgi:hypothetical protein